jgi:kynurenine formamidase
MTRRNLQIIDLSVAIDPDAKEPFVPTIEYESHELGAENAAPLFGLTVDDFPERRAWSNERVTLMTHTGTHVDAPYHYWPTTAGEPARTIDELPIDWFYGDGVLFDFTDKPIGYAITIDDLKEKLTVMNYTLKPYDIILIRSDADKKFYQENYFQSHVGVSAEATHWLIDQGIKVMGTDGWGWDIPFDIQAADYKQNPRDGVLWAAHFVGREKEYCQIEKLANLEKLPRPFGFKVSVFPVKVKGASAGWARPVAIFED